jgi:DNA transformation protein
LKQNSDFKDYVVELLSPHGNIRSRAMFGGYGIYCNELFVAIIVDDTLFFKTSEQTRSSFIERQCKPFEYENKGRHVSMSYYEVPSDAIDSSEGIEEWLHLALKAADKKKKKA